MAASAFYPVQYDVVQDFEPISLISISRLWLVEFRAPSEAARAETERNLKIPVNFKRGEHAVA